MLRIAATNENTMQPPIKNTPKERLREFLLKSQFDCVHCVNVNNNNLVASVANSADLSENGRFSTLVADEIFTKICTDFWPKWQIFSFNEK